MVAAGPVEKITDAEEMLAKARAMEQAGVASCNQYAPECSQNGDAASKQLFEVPVGEEEGHYAHFDEQLENIKRFGPNYLALQSFQQTSREATANPEQ
jgi:bacterioferritin